MLARKIANWNIISYYWNNLRAITSNNRLYPLAELHDSGIIVLILGNLYLKETFFIHTNINLLYVYKKCLF